MAKYFQDINFPRPPKVSKNGTMKPLRFFGEVISCSKKIQFKLGYFSTNAISTLAPGFARFIYNGGVAEFMINHFVSPKDYGLLNDTKEIPRVTIELIESKDPNNLSELAEVIKEASEHFFNCLRYLLEKKKLKIIPVTEADGEMAHYKEAIFTDKNNDKIYINGSCNFTQAGILGNGESFDFKLSWTNKEDKEDIDFYQLDFEKIISKQDHDHFIYLNPADIEKVIFDKTLKSKDLMELLDDETVLLKKIQRTKKLEEEYEKFQEELIDEIEKLKKQPKFPGIEGPRDYQKKAYTNWVDNNYKGLFAMATGTGKTLTAINCLINEYEKNQGVQNNIFVVPGEELVRQWAQELKDCNFNNIYLWYSKNTKLAEQKQEIKILKDSTTLNVVITYDGFISEDFQNIFNFNFEKFTLIFDEVHSLGSLKRKETIEKIKTNRLIGLSATPLRMWDENDENEFIENLFNSKFPNYTFSYSMEEAITKGKLVKYEYHPHFVHLNSEEFDKYLEYTAQIPLGREGKINSFAAIKRQNILDGAFAKEDKLFEILNEIKKEKPLEFILVYCPKGENDLGERKILDLAKKIKKKYEDIQVIDFTAETENRDIILNQFQVGEINMLLSIRCLDQGVNIPRAETGIFLASGKNYREFVQRRGRLLRTYDKADYKKEKAYIYDIIVIPSKTQFENHQQTCKKLILSEFKRLFEFSNLAIKNKDTYFKIENELKTFDYNQNYIEYEIITEQENLNINDNN